MGTPALRFGRYESLFRINAGGMAEVFAARALGEGGFEKIVAVKRILPHLLADGRFVRMFLDEARVAACIESPHVVQTLDVGRDEDGSPYLAMELVVGLTLVELLRHSARARRRLPLGVAVEILAQAASGLDAAHEARTARGEPLGLVHRDVSPQNVLVGADGRVRVSDFGIAKVSLGKLAETQAGEVKGKYAYLSPEQSHGAELDRRSDVFALGIVAWEVIAGRRLFASPSPLDTIDAVRRAPIPVLSELDPTVPRAVSDAVARALERSVDDRWPSARAFGSALRAALPAEVASGPDAVAELVESLRAERVEQLRERIRRATTLRPHETLPDVRVEDAGEPTDPGVGEAVTRLIGATGAARISGAPTPAMTTRAAPERASARAMSRPLAAGLLGAGALALAVGIALTIGPGTADDAEASAAAAPPAPSVTEEAHDGALATGAPPIASPTDTPEAMRSSLGAEPALAAGSPGAETAITEPAADADPALAATDDGARAARTERTAPRPAATSTGDEAARDRTADRERRARTDAERAPRGPGAPPGSEAPRRGRALDLDAFDQAVGRAQ